MASLAGACDVSDATDRHAARRQQHRGVALRPIWQLLCDLKTPSPEDDETLHRLASNAVIVMSVCQNGLGALGHLPAHSSPVIEDDAVGADSIEALGWLKAEISDVAAHCMVLAAHARSSKPINVRAEAEQIWGADSQGGWRRQVFQQLTNSGALQPIRTAVPEQKRGNIIFR